MELSDDERLNLATLLLASVPGPDGGLPLDEDEFYAELERRCNDWEGSVPVEDLWKKLS